MRWSRFARSSCAKRGKRLSAFWRSELFEAAIQPGLGEPPLPGHGGWGHTEDLSCLVDAQPAEKPQLDQPDLSRVDLLQLFQGGVEGNHIQFALALRHGHALFHAHALP